MEKFVPKISALQNQVGSRIRVSLGSWVEGWTALSLRHVRILVVLGVRASGFREELRELWFEG